MPKAYINWSWFLRPQGNSNYVLDLSPGDFWHININGIETDEQAYGAFIWLIYLAGWRLLGLTNGVESRIEILLGRE